MYQILLVVILSVPPLPRRNDRGNDLLLLPPIPLRLLRHALRDLLLLLVVEEYTRAVLRPHVTALAVRGRGVVDLVEELDEGLVGEF